MHDPGHWRDDPEVVESLLAPFQKGIALVVALKFDFCIALQGIWSVEEIYLHRVVNHKIDGHNWVDLFWVPAQAGDRRAHGNQIDDGRYTRKVLHDHTRR